MNPCCFDCKFFCPAHARSADDLAEKDWREDLDGECRKRPPAVGDPVKLAAGDEERWYGNFPRVMAADWCGEFDPCERAREAAGDGARR